jgi:hypothetical protein
MVGIQRLCEAEKYTTLSPISGIPWLQGGAELLPGYPWSLENFFFAGL